MHFKEKNCATVLERTKHDSQDLDNYENLQNEYEKLFAEYNKIKTDDPQNPLLEKKVKEIDEKHKALKIAFSKLS